MQKAQCRACMFMSSQYVELTDSLDEDNGVTYLDGFNKCTRLNAQLADDYSNYLCDLCSNELMLSYEFIRKAEATDKAFKSNPAVCRVGADEEEDPFTLIDCVEEFLDDNDFKEQEDLDSDDDSDLRCSLSDDLSVGNEYQCDQCVSTFSAKHLLDKHFQDEHSEGKTEFVACKKCEDYIQKNYYKTHLKLAHPHDPVVRIKFYCDECPMVLATEANLKRHIANKHREKTIVATCELCGKRFTSMRCHRDHMRRMHQPRNKKLDCKICGRKFAFNRGLKAHMERHYVGNFPCSLCDKRYVRQKDLEIHMSFHTGDQPYQCEHCGKKFRFRTPMTEHVKTQHLGVRYTCTECGRVFKSRVQLKEHSYLHLPLSAQHLCNVCGEAFVRRFRLRHHLRDVHKLNYTEEEFDKLHPKRNLVIKTERETAN